MAGAKGAAGILALIVVLLVLTVHLGTVMTWVMIGLAVLLGFLGLPILGVASKLRWGKERGR